MRRLLVVYARVILGQTRTSVGNGMARKIAIQPGHRNRRQRPSLAVGRASVIRSSWRSVAGTRWSSCKGPVFIASRRHATPSGGVECPNPARQIAIRTPSGRTVGGYCSLGEQRGPGGGGGRRPGGGYCSPALAPDALPDGGGEASAGKRFEPPGAKSAQKLVLPHSGLAAPLLVPPTPGGWGCPPGAR
jgi:hypothetical protein